MTDLYLEEDETVIKKNEKRHKVLTGKVSLRTWKPLKVKEEAKEFEMSQN